jgi:hypothetical protein
VDDLRGRQPKIEAAPKAQWNNSATLRFNGHQTPAPCRPEESAMNGIIYLVGLIVVIMFILSFLGLR